ncbi:MAG: phosphoglucomutase [Sphingobacteriia bacterium 24-36-13]|jgi:phosphoglucomutase|uniref:phospho-sugar mutase n=1 Tax=Sediminibacterium sp. TaxID=1917865 RepID=UPI000BDB5323|nr:phospho-sugar mutase [Sediminibacterium sp.]OYZ53784.1 MAG: phosphoglucomutase [Sphingobacteriia bacterium 24-36-13]OZA65757.1 MAG: phosphoglucomutase [Sphingobacteriia bacterium 39-36-14]HQS24515.1 phospho-sugar mutase [Sediminibacterium sp.]HQS34339.1 phospho-sugar mutase [Sediminibacterium sp.]
MEASIQERVNVWLNGNYDQETKHIIKELQANSPEELADAFYRNLEFGTGGLRGLMGVGTNRVNKYTIGMATQGFANYLKKTYPGVEIKLAIAHDSRNNSRFFAETTANVFAANGMQVFLFEALRPTPELSFAIRHLGCKAGVVCTASHNPKEYNGYKAYWNDGGQLVPPHDKNVITEVEAIQSVDEVKWSGGEANITILGKDLDQAYLEMVKGLSVYPDVIAAQNNLKIVYTPIHGTGITLVPQVLEKFGFNNVHIVEEQSNPDGNFPTVKYPNPEESETMSIGLKKAQDLNADILLGTDPDADRVGIGVKNHKGEWVLMNGNQTAVLAFAYMMEARKAKGIAQPNDMVISTIVTTEMINEVAKQNNVACYNVLTGFKWIAEKIKELEGKENYVIGGEESFGLMIGDQIRDKDAVSAVALMCEMAAYEKNKGKTLFDKMIELYIQYGFYYENLISITKKGMNGQKEIAAMMEGYRNSPPKEINGSAVVTLLDYQLQTGKNLQTGETWTIQLPKSNVLQFITADGSKISARPSGTEPKIKFYFSVKTNLSSKAEFDAKQLELENRINGIINSMNLK